MKKLENFKNIGFSIENEEQLKELCLCLKERSKFVSASNTVKYLVYSASDGTDIWAKLDSNDELVDVVPFFNTYTFYPVIVEELVSGEVSGLRVHAKRAQQDVSFVVEVPDFEMKAALLNCPTESELQITAFAQKLQFFQSETELKGTKYGGLKAEGSLVSKNDFNKDESGDEPIVVISGKVAKLSTIVNPYTGLPFYAMQIKTVGGMMDVVCAADNINNTPCVGGILVGTVYLLARVIRTKRRSEAITGVDVSRFSAMATIRESYERYVYSENFYKKISDKYSISNAKRYLAYFLMLTIIAAPFGALMLLRAIKDRRRKINMELSAEQRLARVVRPIMGFVIRFGAPSENTLPALVLGSFSDIDEDEMAQLVDKFKNFLTARGDETSFLKSVMGDDSYVKDRRRRLPSEITNKEVYVFDLFLNFNSDNKVEDYPSIIACVATEGNFGKIRYVPRSVIQNVLEMTKVKA